MAKRSKGPVNYAVVGLGHITQVAMLPAFAHARRNSRLAALVSDDATKLKTLSRKYRVRGTFSYADYDACLENVDAVYIALPNSMHAEYAVRAAAKGVHVLCEKPMAVTAEDCERMIGACRENQVKLMIAYRLHFEEVNLNVVDLVRRGRIGEPKTPPSLSRCAQATSGRRKTWAAAHSTTSACIASTRRATCFAPSRKRSWRSR